MKLTYETDRLLLCVSHPDAAAQTLLFYQKNKDFLQPYEPVKPPDFYTLQFQHANLSMEYQAFCKAKYCRVWLYLQEDPTIPIGTVCFSNFLHGAFRSCMVGYKTDQAHLHRGYMREALFFLLPAICGEYHFHRVEAYVMPANEPSIRLLESLSFRREGLLHQFAQINGAQEDHYLYTWFAP